MISNIISIIFTNQIDFDNCIQNENLKLFGELNKYQFFTFNDGNTVFIVVRLVIKNDTDFINNVCTKFVELYNSCEIINRWYNDSKNGISSFKNNLIENSSYMSDQGEKGVRINLSNFKDSFEMINYIIIKAIKLYIKENKTNTREATMLKNEMMNDLIKLVFDENHQCSETKLIEDDWNDVSDVEYDDEKDNGEEFYGEEYDGEEKDDIEYVNNISIIFGYNKQFKEFIRSNYMSIIDKNVTEIRISLIQGRLSINFISKKPEYILYKIFTQLVMNSKYTYVHVVNEWFRYDEKCSIFCNYWGFFNASKNHIFNKELKFDKTDDYTFFCNDIFSNEQKNFIINKIKDCVKTLSPYY